LIKACKMQAYSVACADKFSTLRGYETGPFWDWRARAASRDTGWNVLETVDRDHSLEKFLQTGRRRCLRRTRS
jgi:hypothetical protein